MASSKNKTLIYSVIRYKGHYYLSQAGKVHEKPFLTEKAADRSVLNVYPGYERYQRQYDFDFDRSD